MRLIRQSKTNLRAHMRAHLSIYVYIYIHTGVRRVANFALGARIIRARYGVCVCTRTYFVLGCGARPGINTHVHRLRLDEVWGAISAWVRV